MTSKSDKSAATDTSAQDEAERARIAKNAGILADMQAQLQKKAAQLAAEGPVPVAELHTWPDGSQAIGVPPFPEKSPKEREAAVDVPSPAENADRFIPQGMKRSGEPVAAGPGGITESQFVAKAEQQLAADHLSGHNPHTPNPTSASDKPELANTDGTAGLEDPGKTLENPTPEDLAAIAAQIKPEGNFEPTEEQKAAAVAQVARETLGPIYPDQEEKTKKGTAAKKK